MKMSSTNDEKNMKSHKEIPLKVYIRMLFILVELRRRGLI